MFTSSSALTLVNAQGSEKPVIEWHKYEKVDRKPPYELSVPANANGNQTKVTLYIGEPKKDEKNPVRWQLAILTERGIAISGKVIEVLVHIGEICGQNGMPLSQAVAFLMKDDSGGSSAINKGAKVDSAAATKATGG